MAFKYEELTWEQGEKIDSEYKLVNPLTNKPPKTKYWANNEEEKAFIVGLGINWHEEPQVDLLALIWDGKQIDIEFYWDRSQAEDKKIKTRCVKSIKAPAELLEGDKKVKLKRLVEEAVTSYEWDNGNYKFEYQQIAEPQAIKQPSLI